MSEKRKRKTGGKVIIRERLTMLEEWGEQGVLERFLEAGSIRAFCRAHFKVHSTDPNAHPGTSAFYAWLDAGGEERKEWWRQVRYRRAEDYADKAQWRMDTANEDNVRLRAEQAKQDRWHASVLDRERFGSGPQVSINNTTVTLGDTFAAALQEIEARRNAPVIEAEVVEESGDQIIGEVLDEKLIPAGEDEE